MSLLSKVQKVFEPAQQPDPRFTTPSEFVSFLAYVGGQVASDVDLYSSETEMAYQAAKEGLVELKSGTWGDQDWFFSKA